MALRVALIPWAWFLCACVAAEDAARIAANSGVLAARESTESNWETRALGDIIPSIGEFRASPAKTVRINVAGGAILLAAESTGRFDLTRRNLQLDRGEALIQLADDAQAWTLTKTGKGEAWTMPAGGSLLWQAGESNAWHLLAGSAMRQGDKQEFTAPGSYVQAAEGKGEFTQPEDAAAWSKKLLRWTQSSQGPGQLIARHAQDDSPVRLEVARYRVNVVIQPPVVLIQIDQSFYNPYNRQEEGTFVFNLPTGASVSRFAMFVTHDQLIEGELLKRNQADQIYTSIVRKRRDPAILEQIGNNLFRMRVFPIFARDTKRILLDYTVPLISDGGRYRFELPLLSDEKPIWDFTIKGTIYPPVEPQKITSATHPELKFEPHDDGRLTFAIEERMTRPPPSLQISYPAAADRKPAVRAFVGGDPPRQYFMATIPAGENPEPVQAVDPVDALVLVDTSGSAGNLNRARLAVRTIVNQLRPEDRVQLGCVDVDFRPLTKQWLAPDADELHEVYEQLQQQVALGASELNLSLDKAMHQLRTEQNPRRKVLIYIGDGNQTATFPPLFWKRDQDESDQAEPSICMVKVSRQQGDARWMQDAVRATGGRYFDLDSSPTGLDDLFQWSLVGLPTARKRLTVEVDGVPAEDVFVSPDWRTGQDLHVLGRRLPFADLKLMVGVDGHPEQKYEFAVPDAGKDDAVFTGRLWAQRRLDAMLGEYHNLPTANQEARQDAIVELCQEWSLMSPLTAFLVLETEDDYRRWKIDRRKRHRYWSPPEALPFVPAPDGVTLASPEASARRANEVGRQEARSADAQAWDRDFVTKSLAETKKSLATGDVLTAHHHLVRCRDRALRLDPEAFKELYREVSTKIEQENSLQRLGVWRPFADRRTPALWSPPPQLAPLMAQGGLDPDYLDRNPHIQKLIKPIDVPEKCSVRDFVKVVQEQVGIPIIVSEDEIEEDGGTADGEIYIPKGIQGISAYNLIRHALNPHDLEMIYDRHVFHVTTTNLASYEKLSTRIYPVEDLLRTDILPPPSRLKNPLLDSEEFARRRIESRLRQSASVDFVDVSLPDALHQLRKQWDLPILLLPDEITEDGGASDFDVNLKLTDVPAEIILKEMLGPGDLSYVVNHEVLLITTENMALTEPRYRETRLYSAAGLVDGLTPDPVRNPNEQDFDGRWGMGRGGMGGGGMGGMGGGGMGGMGGGGMGGAGMGMGGGFFGDGGGRGGPIAFGGAMGGSTAGMEDMPSSDSAGLSELRPFEDESDENVPAPQPDPIEESDPQLWPNFAAGGSEAFGIEHAMNMIYSTTRDPDVWYDGGGRLIGWHPNSLSISIRQNSLVHQELAEAFAKMRQLADRDPASKLRRPRILLSDAEDADRKFQNLFHVVTRCSGDEDHWAEGGISQHTASQSLVIRQPSQVHEEVENLLARLRRARYIAETVSTRETLAGIDDELNFFDRPALTNLPRAITLPEIAEGDLAAATKALAVRNAAVEMHQSWRVVLPNNQKRELTLQRFENRLKLITPDRILRAEGDIAYAGYPRVSLVEVDAWGEAVRQLADGMLPWLPHRDNAELARLFEIRAIAETEQSATLRLTLRRSPDLGINATFDKQTGKSTAWEMQQGDQLLYRLTFDETQIVARDADDEVLETWELIAEEELQPISPPGEFDAGWIVVRIDDQRDPMVAVRDAMRQNDYRTAAGLLRRLIKQQPHQPLLNFLFAWCREFSGELGPDAREEQRSVLRTVIKSEAHDLIRWLNPTFFPSLGADGLWQLFDEVPADERTLAECDHMVELAASSRRYHEALAAVARAIELDPSGPEANRRRLQQVEFLLRTQDAAAAKQVAEQSRQQELSLATLCEFGDLFYRFDLADVGAGWYELALAQEGIPADERAQLLARQAIWLGGERRWRKLFEASEASPAGDRTGDLYAHTITQEVQQASQAAFLIGLARESQKPALRRRLLLRAAEVTDDRQLAAELVWDLFQEKQISSARIPWMLGRMLDAGRGKDIIALLEGRLRRGEVLDKESAVLLANAYRQAGRDVDARRADSQHRDVPYRQIPIHDPGGRNRGGGFF